MILNGRIPKVYFYIEDCLSDDLPDVDSIGKWQCKNGENNCNGKYHWILQAYLRLKEADFPCELTDVKPNEGIDLAHPSHLIAINKRCLNILFDMCSSRSSVDSLC